MSHARTRLESDASRSDTAGEWWTQLRGEDGPDRQDSVARLHALMLRIARAEASRRSGLNGIAGREQEDLAHQAADDATISVLRKVGDFRGESKFSSWAYKFVVYEVSNKFGRHIWRRDGVQLADEHWERLPGRLGSEPDAIAESRELVGAVRRAVEEELTPRQRDIFVAIVVQSTPLDVLVVELETNRNAIYKTLFDARRKLRAHLVTRGYLGTDQERGT